MPLAKFYIPRHVSVARIQQLADAVHAALVRTCGVPEKDRFQLVIRLHQETMLLNPTFPDVARSSDASIVEITFLAGRTDVQKRALYRDVVEGARAGGWRGDDVMVALMENHRIDWSLGRGQAYVDVAPAH